MLELLVLAIAGFLFFSFPKLSKYFFAVPVLGFVLGGFAWGVAGIINVEFVTLRAFAAFVALGCVLVLFIVLPRSKMQ